MLMLMLMLRLTRSVPMHYTTCIINTNIIIINKVNLVAPKKRKNKTMDHRGNDLPDHESTCNVML